MAIDRGGLQYTITVDGNFAASLTQFKTELRAAQAAWDSFQKKVSQGLTTGGATRQLRETAKEADKAGKAAKSVQPPAAAEKKFNAVEEAVRKLNRELQRLQTTIAAEQMVLGKTGAGETVSQTRAQATAFQQRAKAVQENIKNTEILQGKERQRFLQEQAAARSSGKILADEIKQRERLNLLRQGRGTTGALLTAEERRTATPVAPLLPTLNSETRALQLNTKSLQDNAKAAAAAVEARARLRAETNKLLAAKGLDAQGRPIQPKPLPLTPAQQAQAQLGKDIEGLKRQIEVEQLKRGSKEYKELQKRLQEVSTEKTTLADRINRVSFTFRRLFGILAAFTIARESVNGFVNAIRGAVAASSEFEQAQLGIATVISSVAELYDANGKLIQRGTEESRRFAAAQQLSAQVFQQLRTAAQTTSASFSELVDGFRIAAGVTLGAGFTLQQTVEFVTNIGRAARVSGVGANQLAEEIRSLVLGTISLRNTKIATILDISNEDIRRATEANNLVGLLQEKFRSFETAEGAIFETFASQAQSTADAVRFLLDDTSNSFTETLKVAISRFRSQIEEIREVGGTKQVITSPEAIKALEPLFDGLAVAAEAISQAFNNIESDDLRQTFEFFGEIIGSTVRSIVSLGSLLFEAIQPAIRSLTAIFKIVKGVILLLGAVDKALGGWGGKILVLASQLGVVLLLHKAILAALTAIKGSKAFTAMSEAIKGITSQIVSLTRQYLPSLAKAIGNIPNKLNRWLFILTIVVGLAILLVQLFGFLEKLAGGLVDYVIGPITDKLDELESVISERLEEREANKYKIDISTNITTLSRQIKKDLNEIDDQIKKKVSDINQRADISVRSLGFEGSDSFDLLEEALTATLDKSEELIKLERAVIALREKSTALRERQTILERDASLIQEKELDQLNARFNAGEKTARVQELIKDAQTKISVLQGKITDTSIEQQGITKELEGLEKSLALIAESRYTAEARLLSLKIRSRTETIRLAQADLQLQARIAQQIAEAQQAGRPEQVQAIEERAKIEQLSLELSKGQEKSLKTIAGLQATLLILQQAGAVNAEFEASVQQAISAEKVKQATLEAILRAQIDAALAARKNSLKAVRDEASISERSTKLEAERAEVELRYLAARQENINLSKEGLEALEASKEIELSRLDAVELQLDLQQKLTQQQAKLNAILSDSEESIQARNAIEAETNSIKSLYVKLIQLALATTEELEELEKRRLNNQEKEIENQQRLIALRNAIGLSQVARTGEEELFAAQREYTLAVARNSLSSEELQLLEQRLALREFEIRSVNEIESINDRIKELLEQQRALNQDDVRDKQKIEELAGQIAQEELKRAIAQATQVEEQKKLLALLRQAEELQTFGGGAQKALQGFAQQNNQFNLGQSITRDTLSGLQGFATTALSGAIADAFDPNVNFDLQEAFAQFTLQLGQQILDAVIGNLIAELLSSLGLVTSSAVPLTLAAEALEAAAIPLGAVASKLLLAAILLKGANVMSGGIVVPAAAEGGFVQSFARGGRARHPFSRPDGLDHRDRVPVWTRPGEWIIRPEAVQKYGSSLFAALNSRRLNPDAVRGIAATTSPVKTAVVDKPGFATGGMIRSGATGAMSGSTSMTLVQPIMLNDEQTMDQALAAGPKALLRFAKTNRNDMRAALGMPRRGT